MFRKMIVKYGEIAAGFTGICALIGGVLLFFKADLPPFASMTRADTIVDELKNKDAKQKQNVDEVRLDQRVLTRAVLRMDRKYWEEQLEDAEKDLAANPASTSAKKAVREAKEQIAYIDEQLKPGRPAP